MVLDGYLIISTLICFNDNELCSPFVFPPSLWAGLSILTTFDTKSTAYMFTLILVIIEIIMIANFRIISFIICTALSLRKGWFSSNPSPCLTLSSSSSQLKSYPSFASHFGRAGKILEQVTSPVDSPLVVPIAPLVPVSVVDVVDSSQQSLIDPTSLKYCQPKPSTFASNLDLADDHLISTSGHPPVPANA